MLSALLSSLILTAAHAQTGPLLVVNASPSGPAKSRDAASAVSVTFSLPMVPLTSSLEAGKFCPLSLEPAVEGRCRWQGTNVLAFEPSRPLPVSTAFKAIVPAGTKSLVSGQSLEQGYAWTFETPRPSLADSRPRDGDHWVGLDGLLFLQFNLEMDPRRARDFIDLVESGLDGTGEAASIPVGARRPTAKELESAWGYIGDWPGAPSTSTVIVLKPSRALAKERAYRLVLKEGLPAAEGSLGLGAAREVRFETFYAFDFLEARIDDCLPAAPALSFSNPVRYADLLKNMAIEPQLDLAQPEGYQNEASGSLDPARRRISHSLMGASPSPGTEYRLRISSGLKDIYGNDLGREASASFRAGDFCPRFTMAEAVGVLEDYLPALHPAAAVNAEQVPLQMAAIPEDGLIPFFQGLDWGEGQPQGLKAPFIEKILKPSTVKNRKTRLGIDLREALGKGNSGFVFLQAQDPSGHWRKALVQVTRLALTVKSSPDSTLAWATDLRTGAPVPGASIEIRGEDNRVLQTGRTDINGIFQGQGWKALGITEWKRWQRPKLWIFAKSKGEFSALTTAWRGGLEPWRFNVSYDDFPRPFKHEGILFTDRGIYRPGEKVLAKGILRELSGGDWEPTSLKTVRVRIQNPRGAEAFVSTLTVGSSSAFDFAFPVPADAPTGTYEMRATDAAPEPDAVVQAAGEEGDGAEGEGQVREDRLALWGTFRVEAFKPATFELKVRSSKDEYLSGERFEASLDGWYLFGAPMADAPFDAKLRLEPGFFSPPGFDGFSFGPGWWEDDRVHFSGQLLASSTGALDSQGKASFEALLPPGRAGSPVRASLEASVLSPERQRLFGRASSIVHPSSVYLGIRPDKTFLDKGKGLSADIVALRPDGRPAEGLRVEGRLVRRDWLSVQKAGLSGRLEWASERRDADVATFSFVSSKSTFTWTFVPERPGLHFLKARTSDEQGREALSGDSIYVVGKGEAWWERSDTDVVELVPDKKSYKPGDTARILVKSPFSKTRALLTLEREKVIERRLVWLEGGAGFLTVPIKPEHAPNVCVGVVLMQGRSGTDKFSADGYDAAKPQAKFGYASLSVDPGGRRLSVSLKTDAGEYRPRGRVNASLSVKDSRGKGVESDAAVFAVDEGVLALTGYGVPDAFGTFYGPRPNLVETASLLQYVIGQRSFGEKGRNRGGGGGGAGLAGIDLRSRFVPTAYWNPSVKTDKNGSAALSFELPDNLSRFRLMAVAQSGRTFGSGESLFSVKKPLLLKPSLPRTARLGDAFQGGVVVHNYTGSSATVRVGLAVRGDAVSAEGAGERSVEVGSGKAVELLWPMSAGAVGGAAFEFRAAAGRETDGLSWKLEVGLPSAMEHAATAGVTESRAEEKAAPPKSPRPEAGSLDVSLSASAMAGLGEGARFLLGYPYGCLEQKLSRAFPAVVGSDLVESFGLGDLRNLKAKAQEVFSGLKEYQTPSGGFGYWPSPLLPDPYLTAYALHAAALARKEGYSVDEEVLGKALDWLRRFFYEEDPLKAYPYSLSEDYSSRAYALYALSLHGRKENAGLSNLFLKRDQIPFAGKAHLLKAAKLLDSDPLIMDALASDLLNASKQSPATMHFESPDKGFEWIHESSARTTALVLQALLEARGGFAGDDKAVRWLMEERKDKGRWRTTQENFAALYALQDYFRRHEKETPDFRATARAGGTEWTESFAGRSLASKNRSFPMSGLSPDGKLTLEKTGTGRLYYALRMNWIPEDSQAPRQEGLSVEKTIESLNGPKGASSFPPGSRAVVTLKVKTPQDRTFVVLDDPVPAGFEIVDPSFASEGAEDALVLAEKAKDNPYWGTFQRNESYDDRILVFADYLAAGEHKYSYLVQATTPGRYRMPETRVEQMYQPEVFGTTTAGEVSVGR